MTKKRKIDDKDFIIETYRQYITLLGGSNALSTIDRQINIERTNRMLEIADANKFNKAILETAILDNV